MNTYLKNDEWCIIEEGFNPKNQRSSESIFSLGNGKIGQRANFEEKYSGDTLKGNYIAGIYYPDKTKVGWWKNGYPEYFAKVLNAPNWIGIDVHIGDQMLDLAKVKTENFRRILNMREGVLERSFIAEFENGNRIEVNAKRFISLTETELGCIKYEVKSLNVNGKITVTPYIDADVINEDSNYNEKFWEELIIKSSPGEACVATKTKKLDFHACTAMKYRVDKNGTVISNSSIEERKKKFISQSVSINCKKNDVITIYKYGVVTSSENHEKDKIIDAASTVLKKSFKKGFEKLHEDHKKAWESKWSESDIVIEGDIAAQQAIRFNIFQLNQTYTGDDERLNIGPKGFTGEKYGGSTYWDTEAYCVPFYLRTADENVARNLLLYRYRHLPKAIENAEKLGFKDGAALYPMVTMNGEECHNEWEITFEEIHRNGAIAYAIYNYTRYTGDETYLFDYGLEVLIAISRFWAQRIHFSGEKKKYVMLGVTGPNEYENNVNNNWYTNTIATWCMEYTINCIAKIEEKKPEKFKNLKEKINFNELKEVSFWTKIIENMYYPEDEVLGVFLQQEGYMDKEQLTVKELPAKERPINQKWSWDRILRSCFIKQADVLQGIYFFEDRYNVETIKRNFDFYESRTVHESSLSPCVHSILAAKLGYEEKAYELYLRTARLDLDDYNNEVYQGLHITSMAGTWMSVVEGFGGMRIKKGELHFNPFIPKQWKQYSFNVKYRGHHIKAQVTKNKTTIQNDSGTAVKIFIYDTEYHIGPKSVVDALTNE
ncbi:MAG: maltose phosphorylase [Bacteroidetes bacterium GWC2_33_15]|nr:MAG: maltose phosphorylase [Bacteroidetes bacterium GWA2_33_15]OFX49099.1 MAG: maltose phosphorylase [Bacteroidetes bacterium GWC2_33_15]OFX64867.1 MAG: maltose phosphorylase [Bacteroidetes bacterium GWB2_32_14]OFX68575.1 MAG: maltose phosphorylase [Bacteroidetes bacterium GWD2_33_33]HAN17421.1 family 65 glycosyl hydrolase [Bacteroidales bacterium]